MEALANLGLALIPLLIAVDPAAAVTIYLSLTERLTPRERLLVIRDAIITAVVLGFVFMFLGALIFSALGIDEHDFQIGGGLILLVLSLADLVTENHCARAANGHVGIVPLGTPLIIGPAVLTAITLLQNQYGNALAGAAFIVTIAILAGALAVARHIARFVGSSGLAAISKVVSILLAAFAVRLIRTGVTAIISG